MTAPGDLVTVTLLHFPITLYREASEHQDELQREFSLIQQSSSLSDTSVPRRLLQLVDELQARFSAFVDTPRAAINAALAQGVTTMDVEYQIPAHARQSVIDLGVLLDEADEFCRSGDHLLTLATPPQTLALRRWFLGEFVAQIDGAAPTPWNQWEARARAEAGSPAAADEA